MTEDKVAVELAELRGAVENFMANWQKQDDRAARSREDLRNKMTDLQVAQAGIMRDLADVVNDVAEIRPKVERLEATYNQGRGAVWTLGILRVIGWGLMMALAWIVANMLPLFGFKR